LAVPTYFKPAIDKGEVVAVFFGKASSTLEEGQYRIRVKHPKFGSEVRHVQVVSGQTTDIRVQLHSGASAPLNEAVNAVKRLFGN
jgi:hypothetical protein